VQAEKRALVIGIGAYPDVDYGWPVIHGDNDIAFATGTLLANGFSISKIDTLRNEQATYQAICKAFKRLIASAQTNDVVYIHFSGHGQQITDLDGDEEDGYDEAWVAYEALQEPTPNYHGEHHITDDQLNAWLKQLRQNVGINGKIIVVSDACHSGTSTRDITEPTEIRGAHSKFELNGIKHPYKEQRTIEWISISACADNECNRQHRLSDGKQCGSLTYALYLLRDNLSTIVADQLSALLNKTINELVKRPQTPLVELPNTNNIYLFE
jgi:hypothetical protein